MNARGRWYVEEAMGGAGVILEQDAGADGGPGHVAHVELYEDAVEICRWWNGRLNAAPTEREDVRERFVEWVTSGKIALRLSPYTETCDRESAEKAADMLGLRAGRGEGVGHFTGEDIALYALSQAAEDYDFDADVALHNALNEMNEARVRNEDAVLNCAAREALREGER